jgi:hypothetical protein
VVIGGGQGKFSRGLVTVRVTVVLGVVSIVKMLSVQSCPSCIPRWLQGEWLTEKKVTKCRQTCQDFLLLVVHLWAQVGVSAFLKKQFLSTCYKASVLLATGMYQESDVLRAPFCLLAERASL